MLGFIVALAVESTIVNKPSFQLDNKETSLRFQLYENGPMCTMIIAKDRKARLICDKVEEYKSK